MANSVDPDQMPHSVASDLSLHCLPRPRDFKPFTCSTQLSNLASVAQLDACPTGYQEVAGWTPAGSATFFHGDWS